MLPSPPRETQDIVVAAAYWLMHRYQHTQCEQLVRLIEQHLNWVEAHRASPTLAGAYSALVVRWRAIAPVATSFALTH